MKNKRRFGDRKDGALVRDLNAMGFIMPNIYPNRCDNEAYISERIDLTNINAWLSEKNSQNPEFKYTLFQVIVTALIKTITLRPKMNRFIANKNVYQRSEVSASFVIKKQFEDDSEEGMAFVRTKEQDTIEQVRERMQMYITDCRKGKIDTTEQTMNIFNKMPRFLSKSIISFVRFLDARGKVPASIIKTDPYYSSVILSNLGSIKLKSGYHHLTNWGTTSLFCVIGEKKMSPFFAEDGTVTMKETLDLGLTVDERIADGYYFSKTIKLFKKLLENPALLEEEMGKSVEY